MPALIGKYDYTLDLKNRLFVPPRYRELLAVEHGRHFVLSMGIDRCLYLFLPSQWEALISAGNESIRFGDKRKQRAVKRVLFSGAMEAAPDEQGRILVPQELKEYAALRKEVVIAGSGNKAELWDRRRFELEQRPALGLFKKLGTQLDL